MKRQKECFIGVSAVVHLFLKIAGAMPVVFLLFLVVNVLHGTAWALETLARQVFFDGLQSAVERNSLQAAYSGALWVGAAAVYVQVLNGAGNFIGQHIFNPRAVNTLTREFHTQTAQLPLYEFEKETTLETIEKARQGINGTVQLLRAVISIAMFNLPYVAFMGVYLYRLDPILVLSLLFIFSPMVCAQVIKRKAYRRLTDETAALEREYRHYSDCMIDKRYWKETRTLGAVGFFMERFRAVLAKYDKKLWETDSRLYRTELLMRVLTLLGYLGVLFLLVRSLLSGNISAGAFAAVFTSIASIFRFMENIVARSAGNISRHMASVGNYLEFCRQNGFAADDGQVRGASDGCCIAEESESGRESCAVIVEDVSFAYPNADRPFLDRISVRIRTGETVAVVGENGAGKTTFVKLVLGLYEPSSGWILRERDSFVSQSAVFQNFQKYRMRLDDNICLKELECRDAEEMERAASLAGVEYGNSDLYPEKFGTLLGREFGGAELSGGQWQRIAIARGLYKEHDMIVLDEPTASIDPLEETRLYRMFARMAEGKTAFIVTHRIGSAQLADRILVFDKGKIVEQGTHEELIKSGGKYAFLYREQGKWY